MTVELFHHGRHETNQTRREQFRDWWRGPGGTWVFVAFLLSIFAAGMLSVNAVLP